MRTIKIVSTKEFLENSKELVKFSIKLQHQVHIEDDDGKVFMSLGVGMEPIDPDSEEMLKRKKESDDLDRELEKEIGTGDIDKLDTSWLE